MYKWTGLLYTYHSSLAASPGQIVFGRDMIINAVYLANWKDLHARRDIQIRQNNFRENKSRIPHPYAPGDSVYIRKSNIDQKLNHLQGPFVIDKVQTNGTVTIRRFTTVSERVDFTPHLHAPLREARAVRPCLSPYWLIGLFVNFWIECLLYVVFSFGWSSFSAEVVFM